MAVMLAVLLSTSCWLIVSWGLNDFPCMWRRWISMPVTFALVCMQAHSLAQGRCASTDMCSMHACFVVCPCVSSATAYGSPWVAAVCTCCCEAHHTLVVLCLDTNVVSLWCKGHTLCYVASMHEACALKDTQLLPCIISD